MLESPVAECNHPPPPKKKTKKNPPRNGFTVAQETIGQYYKVVKTNIYAFEKLDIALTQQNHDSSTFSSLSA